jgi:hypothetical protein
MEENNSMTPTMRETLQKTAGWMNFYVVLLYIMSGLLLVGLVSLVSQNRYFLFPVEIIVFIGLLAIGIIVFYAVSFGKYIKAIREAILAENVNLLVNGLSGYKTAFVITSVITGLSILVTLFGAVASSMQSSGTYYY